MQYAAIFQALSLIVPAVLAGSKKIIKGNERYLIAVGMYFFFQYLVRKYASENISKGIQDNPNGGAEQNSNALAMAYYAAMFPSGQTFFPDGTDEQALFELAARTHHYGNVFNSYQVKYRRNLTDDLQSELSKTEYQTFISILNK